MKYLLALALIATVITPVHAEQPPLPHLNIPEFEEELMLGEYIRLKQMPDERRSAADLARQLPDFYAASLAAADETWQANSQWFVRAGAQYNWARLDLVHDGDEARQYVIEITGLGIYSYIYRDHTGRLISHVDDMEAPFMNRRNFDTKMLVQLDMQPGHHYQLFFTIHTQPNQALRFALMTPGELKQQRTAEHLIDGFYFGLVTALVIYNIFLFVAMRQVLYLLFAAFLASSAGTVYMGSGLYGLYGLQDQILYSFPILFTITGLVDLFAALFSMVLLRIRETYSRLFMFWIAVIVINTSNSIFVITQSIVGTFGDSTIMPIIFTSSFATLFEQIVYIYTLVYYWRRSTVARYWFLAITLHSWMYILWTVMTPESGVSVIEPRYLVQLTTVIDTFLLSALLAYNYKQETEERVEAQEQTVESLRLARDLEQAKSNFVSTVGHDLHGPVRAISFFSESLKSSADEKQAEQLDHIDDNIPTITDMLDRLVQLSRMEYRANNPTFEATNIREMLTTLKSEFDNRAADKNLTLNFSSDDLLVESDRVCLSQILRNLIDNAIKYTPEGEVRVYTKPQGKNGEVVQVIIEDTGQGIAEANLAHIFDEFYQVHASADTSAGVGLGLSIVSRLTRLLDIHINVSSSLGEGTRFELTIPAASPVDEPLAGEAIQTNAEDEADDRLKAAIFTPEAEDGEQLAPLADMLRGWGAEINFCESVEALIRTGGDAGLVLMTESGLIKMADFETNLTVVFVVSDREIGRMHGIEVVSIESDIQPIRLRSLVQRYRG